MSDVDQNAEAMNQGMSVHETGAVEAPGVPAVPAEKSISQIMTDAATAGKGEVIEIDVSEAQKCVGKYITVFRKKTEAVAKVESVENNEFVTYQIMTGPDKGNRYRARFFAKTLKVYDEQTVILAMLK